MTPVKKPPSFFLPVLLLFILGDVICDNFLLQAFSKGSSYKAILILFGFLLLQTIASPLQAGFSDFYCRKKSLVFAISTSLISLILIFFYNQNILGFFVILLSAIGIKGAFGNTIPLAWAAIADTQDKNFRFSLALSTASYAIGYIVLAVLKYLGNLSANLIYICLYIILVILAFFVFEDIRDKENSNLDDKSKNRKPSFLILIKQEVHSIFYNVLAIKAVRNGLIAFTLWEVSLYSILILFIDFSDKYSAIAIAMMIGYMIGVGMLRICNNFQDTVLIAFGFILTVAFSIVFFILFYLNFSLEFSLLFYGFFHAMGNAFLCPTIMSFLSKQSKKHDQGKIFGLVISADTIAFLIGTTTILIYEALGITLVYLLWFSVLSFIVSWWPYAAINANKSNL